MGQVHLIFLDVPADSRGATDQQDAEAAVEYSADRFEGNAEITLRWIGPGSWVFSANDSDPWLGGKRGLIVQDPNDVPESDLVRAVLLNLTAAGMELRDA